MTKKVFTIIGLALLIVGAGLGAFTGLEVAVWLELAGAAVTLALAIVNTIKKAEHKDWKLYTAIACEVIGVILCVFAGVADSVIKSVIAGVIGLLILIASVIIPLFKK